MKNFAISATVVAAALTLGACAPEGEPEIEETETAVATTPEPMTETTMPEPVNVTLSAVENSGIDGSMRLEHAGDSVHVDFMLVGLESGTEYTAHVHRGTCDEDRGRAASMKSFTMPAEGEETRVSFAKSALDPAETEYFVELHGADDSALACGDLPEHAHTTSTPMESDAHTNEGMSS